MFTTVKQLLTSIRLFYILYNKIKILYLKNLLVITTHNLHILKGHICVCIFAIDVQDILHFGTQFNTMIN